VRELLAHQRLPAPADEKIWRVSSDRVTSASAETRLTTRLELAKIRVAAGTSGKFRALAHGRGYWRVDRVSEMRLNEAATPGPHDHKEQEK
jgi:hypothetical protein